MLIVCVSPNFQTKHACDGKYKYNGHTISPPPKQIVQIANPLPCHLSNIDILFVRRHGAKGKCYKYYVTKSHAANAFLYKIQNTIVISNLTTSQFHHFHNHALISPLNSNIFLHTFKYA